jgi:plasmid maintenance system killer protein|tara:strand:+ start:28 stop:1158 length:1131 start_codon:yes stop_codon:yes gene_type:complete
MANGYEKGDYLAQFLTQLPQIYQANKSAELQRERFEYMKEEGIKDDIYRGQVLTANEERNNLAREQFEQRKTQNTQDEEYRTATLESNSKSQLLTGLGQAINAAGDNEDLKELLLMQHPAVKGNQQMIDTIHENRDIKESMKQQVYSIEGLNPIQALKTGRPLYNSRYLDPTLKRSLDETLKEKESDLRYTLTQLKDTPEGLEFAKYYEQFENLDKYLPAGTTPIQRATVSTTLLNNMQGVYDQAKEKEMGLEGDYNKPIFGDIVEVDDEELDKLLDDNIVEIDFTGTGAGAGAEIETAGKSFSVGTMSADVQKLKESNIYDKLRGKTTAQKKQMIEQVVGREVSEEEMGNIILKSKLPRIQFDIGTGSKGRRFQK